ncbi:hypothetical protein I6F30_35130 [Bradyrhizobium sp. NBAIM20]|uniref:hypothetical protein n=1 Tax=unclassified Bradyrhizobium TaxID=2631580 RepID=UPI001CD734B2|nr:MULTISPECIES: hypothetical protein [unclassified Bradyrhizobium]MCA1416325.1 hypothetical protein [Bradyrhizobium sp. NBAIM20]MCA1466103.1 hypothetical protein [Bradyrhizobium sp. NBAIM18]
MLQFCNQTFTKRGTVKFYLRVIVFYPSREVAMAGVRDYFYKFMNLFGPWPSRQKLEDSAAELNAQERPPTTSGLDPEATSPGAYCCVLWWDESVGRPDEAITVSNERVCRRLAEANNARYRLREGRCSDL